MVTTSYPRFPGDGVGSFVEPIAKGVAALGHEVHLVAPWHPAITRAKVEDGVHFHFFRYAPLPSLNVFGYAAGLREDTALRAAAWAVAPLAVGAGWFKTTRVIMKRTATVVHAHWVIPGGFIASLATRRLPLVVSMHGSDVFIAERHRVTAGIARGVFRRAGWVTACSDDLRDRAIALGADQERIETVPYGVDAKRFAPNPRHRADIRREFDLGDAPVVFTAGRLVRKKGFEYLIAASRELAQAWPSLRVVIAGDGDLRDELTRLAGAAGPQVMLIGDQSQDDIARWTAAADVIAIPSAHDAAGNVDGLPNFALESLASATAVVATTAGGLPQAIEDGVQGSLVPERDSGALARAIGTMLGNPVARKALGDAARARMLREFGWARVAERFAAAYVRAREVPPVSH